MINWPRLYDSSFPTPARGRAVGHRQASASGSSEAAGACNLTSTITLPKRSFYVPRSSSSSRLTRAWVFKDEEAQTHVLSDQNHFPTSSSCAELYERFFSCVPQLLELEPSSSPNHRFKCNLISVQQISYSPHVNKFLQCSFLTVEEAHHVHVLLVQTDASHSVIRKKRLRCLILRIG